MGRRADRVFVAADLDEGNPVEVELDALARDGAADLDHDPAAGEVQDVQALDERHDENAATHDDLLPGQIGGDLTGFDVADLLALASGDDEGLVWPGHLVARGDEHPHHDEQDDQPDDGNEDDRKLIGRHCSRLSGGYARSVERAILRGDDNGSNRHCRRG